MRDNVGFDGEGGRAAAAADAARARICDRRHRLGVRCCARKPASARASTSSTARCRRARPSTSIGQVQRDGGESEKIAEHWLDTVGTSRAFLFLHLYEPHKPYAPPDRFAAYAPYDGEIAYTDEIVGRLVQYLKTHQLYDRSTIVLLSDHGEGLGDHGEQEHGLFVYDEAIHVPLIIKQEGNAGAGRRIADLVQHIDLVPTILDLVKAPVRGNLRGRSLKPVLEGSGKLPSRRRSTRRRSTPAITSAGAS